MLDKLTIEHCRAWTKNYEVVVHSSGEAGYVAYKNSVVVCAIYKEVDGYWHADRFGSGAWSGPDLIALGFILLELNEPWDAEVKAYFDGLPG